MKRSANEPNNADPAEGRRIIEAVNAAGGRISIEDDRMVSLDSSRSSARQWRRVCRKYSSMSGFMKVSLILGL